MNSTGNGGIYSYVILVKSASMPITPSPLFPMEVGEFPVVYIVLEG